MAQHHSAPAGRQITPGEVNGGKIRASHLLVKHRDSRRPSSWREAEITRSKEEALRILGGYQQRIESGETTLSDLAASESDCSSARKGGDLYELPFLLSSSFFLICRIVLIALSVGDSSVAVICRRSLRRRLLRWNRVRSVGSLRRLPVFISFRGKLFIRPRLKMPILTHRRVQ